MYHCFRYELGRCDRAPAAFTFAEEEEEEVACTAMLYYVNLG